MSGTGNEYLSLILNYLHFQVISFK